MLNGERSLDYVTPFCVLLTTTTMIAPTITTTTAAATQLTATAPLLAPLLCSCAVFPLPLTLPRLGSFLEVGVLLSGFVTMFAGCVVGCCFSVLTGLVVVVVVVVVVVSFLKFVFKYGNRDVINVDGDVVEEGEVLVRSCLGVGFEGWMIT